MLNAWRPTPYFLHVKGQALWTSALILSSTCKALPKVTCMSNVKIEWQATSLLSQKNSRRQSKVESTGNQKLWAMLPSERKAVRYINSGKN